MGRADQGERNIGGLSADLVMVDQSLMLRGPEMAPEIFDRYVR
jgi:hypothetical protein